jgi:tetratricopeptide (TPR) repeat protein
LFGEILSEAHPDLYLRMAEVSRALGETETADRHEAEFVRLATAPGAEALNAHPLAVYYASSPVEADRDRALKIIQRDLDRRGSIEAYEVLSWVRLRRGELDEALVASGEARRWGEPGPSSDYVRARILEALNRLSEAEPLYRRALAEPTQLDHHVLQDLWH